MKRRELISEENTKNDFRVNKTFEGKYNERKQKEKAIEIT